MNEKAWLERYACALAKEQAAKQAEQHGPDEQREVSAQGTGCSTLELIKQESMGGEGRRMDSGAHDKGWQIAEVERLLGMPRRDIQRACYEGQGGAGLVHPKESSWGKRSYEASDLARLFQVKRQRDAGRSLPEVRRAFDEVEADPDGWERFEADQIARMRAGAERAGAELEQAEALRAATAGGSADEAAARLDAVIDGIFLQGAVALRREAVAAGDAAAVAQLDAALTWFAGGSEQSSDAGSRLAVLWNTLEKARSDGDMPDAERLGYVLEGADLDVLAALLETPGMELALELRLGAGGYDYALRALRG